MSIGSRLTDLRIKKGLTRVQLAEELKIPMTTLRNYEQDQREPGHKFLLEVSRYFGVTTDYILENEKAPAPEGAEEKMSDEDMKLSADLRAVLAKHGVLSADGDITDEQADIIFHAICLMRAALKETVKK
jgi:transcriptional regulator with XRE-family HTH domain